MIVPNPPRVKAPALHSTDSPQRAHHLRRHEEVLDEQRAISELTREKHGPALYYRPCGGGCRVGCPAWPPGSPCPATKMLTDTSAPGPMLGPTATGGPPVQDNEGSAGASPTPCLVVLSPSQTSWCSWRVSSRDPMGGIPRGPKLAVPKAPPQSRRMWVLTGHAPRTRHPTTTRDAAS